MKRPACCGSTRRSPSATRSLAPRVPAFLARYPGVRLELTVRDQQVDPAAEGLDVLVRIGGLGDSSLVARRLGETRTILCASPAYLRRRGAPATPRDLAAHDCIGYLRDGRPAEYRFPVGDRMDVVDVAGRFHANEARLLLDAALGGLGIVAVFDFLVADALARGALVPVLEDHPLTTRPIHALYPRNRQLLPKVRVFLDFLSEAFDALRTRPTAEAAARGLTRTSAQRSRTRPSTATSRSAGTRRGRPA